MTSAMLILVLSPICFGVKHKLLFVPGNCNSVRQAFHIFNLIANGYRASFRMGFEDKGIIVLTIVDTHYALDRYFILVPGTHLDKFRVIEAHSDLLACCHGNSLVNFGLSVSNSRHQRNDYECQRFHFFLR